MSKELVIITIPAYNEEQTIGKSIDKTAEIAKQHGALVYSHPYNLGLAETFRTEMKKFVELSADIIVHTDADGQYPSYFIPNLIRKIQEGYDLVLGSRFGKGIYSGSFMKKFGNIAFAYVFSGLLKRKIKDTTTGFRAFRNKVAQIPIINDFTYTQEQLIRAAKAKMNITEVPITTNLTRESRLFKFVVIGTSVIFIFAFAALINCS